MPTEQNLEEIGLGCATALARKFNYQLLVIGQFLKNESSRILAISPKRQGRAQMFGSDVTTTIQHRVYQAQPQNLGLPPARDRAKKSTAIFKTVCIRAAPHLPGIFIHKNSILTLTELDGVFQFFDVRTEVNFFPTERQQLCSLDMNPQKSIAEAVYRIVSAHSAFEFGTRNVPKDANRMVRGASWFNRHCAEGLSVPSVPKVG